MSGILRMYPYDLTIYISDRDRYTKAGSPSFKDDKDKPVDDGIMNKKLSYGLPLISHVYNALIILFLDIQIYDFNTILESEFKL